jgi:GTP pyrophosphokinase
MNLFNVFLRELNQIDPDFDISKLKKAYLLASKVHSGQKRSSGEDYIIHVIEVARILLNINFDETILVSALLHDTAKKDPEVLDTIKIDFGEEVYQIINSFTQVAKVESFVLDQQVDALKRMLLGMAKDVRMIYIKLANRLHNLRTIDRKSEEMKKKIAQETLSIYAPIARRIGVYFFKDELEVKCFEILYPKDYQELSKKIEKYTKKQDELIKQAKKDIEILLKQEKIPYFSVSSRIKQKYSIYRKMQKRGEDDLANIYDFYAIRVITDNIEHCYSVLGIIHKLWTPISKRIKDYIAVPKMNGYQSLHTTVLGVGQKKSIKYKPVEIQIRTKEMHNRSEKGRSAHWAYKEDLNLNQEWIESIVNIANEITDSSQDFLDELISGPLENRILVLTPRGDIKDLPINSTPVDFAYSIHTDIGNKLMIAKVNGKTVPLHYELKSGDIVEVKTDKNRLPNLDWLSFVKTSNAKNSIRSWLKKQSQENLLSLGREEVNNLLKRIGKPLLDSNFSILKEYKGRSLTLKERENLLCQIGEGSQKASDILKNIFQQKKLQKNEEKQKNPLEPKQVKVLVMGDNMLKTKLSSCCNPKPYDLITGYVTRGNYVSVHRMDCSFVLKSKEDRFVECHWEGEEELFEVEFVIQLQNVIGIVAKILEVFSKRNINLDECKVKMNKPRNRGDLLVKFMIDNLDKLSKISAEIESIDYVLDVKRKVL